MVDNFKNMLATDFLQKYYYVLMPLNAPAVKNAPDIKAVI